MGAHPHVGSRHPGVEGCKALDGLERRAHGSHNLTVCLQQGLKPKDLIGMPWRVAFAAARRRLVAAF